mgnify:CR=1 FL=1
MIGDKNFKSMRKYQYYDTGDDGDVDAYGVNWLAQTFTPEAVHMISKVKLKLFRVGDPGTVKVSIKNTTAGKPSGADLCSGTIEGINITEDTNGEWYEITLGSGYTFEKNKMYAIVVRAPDGDASNKVSWRRDTGDATYPGGTLCTSSDSGVDWGIISGSDCMFEEWGVGEPAPTAVVWGLLPKSQIDSELIEEAIARMIAEHNEDETAHLGEGQSLQSHKASEIIDHVVASIIADKIKDGEVTVSKFKYDKLVIECIFESLDYWTQTKMGSAYIYPHLASVKIGTGATINSICDMSAEAYVEGEGMLFSKAPQFMTVVKFNTNSDQEAYLVANDYSLSSFGFKIVGATLYALHLKDSIEYTTDISSGVDITQYHRYKAIYYPGTKIEFYVDDVLKATHTENLPEESEEVNDIGWFNYRIKNTAAADKSMRIRYLVFTQDT